MTILAIDKYPHPILRRRCEKLQDIDDAARRLADDMRATMLAANGIGLAAPQVGKALRLLVMDVSEKRDDGIALANPEILRREGSYAMEEGCLSVPGVTALIPRAQYVEVGGLNMDGEQVVVKAEELKAVCLQHEIDHLNGVLFFDHLSALKRERLLAKYKKLNDEKQQT